MIDGKPAGGKLAGVKSGGKLAGVKSDDNPAGVKPVHKPTGSLKPADHLKLADHLKSANSDNWVAKGYEARGREVDEGHLPVPYRSSGSSKNRVTYLFLVDCYFDRTTYGGVLEEYLHFPAIPMLIYYKIILSRI